MRSNWATSHGSAEPLSDGAIAYQSKGPLPGSGPEPFVNYGWAQ